MGSTVLLHLSRVRSTVLRCPSRVVRLPAGSTVRPRGPVTLRLLSSRLRAGRTVRPPGRVTLRLLRSRLPVGSTVLLHLSRARSTVPQCPSRVCRLRDRSMVLRRSPVRRPRLSSRLPPGSMALPQPRATPPNLSRKITLTRPRIAMPSPSRRLILSPVPPRPLRLTMLAFLNPLVRLSRSRRQPRPTPLLFQQGSLPLSRRRCLPPTR